MKSEDFLSVINAGDKGENLMKKTDKNIYAKSHGSAHAITYGTRGSYEKVYDKYRGKPKNKGCAGYDSGVISIEASVVMFLVMIMIFLCMYGMMYVMNCETIRSYMYEKIYTAPLIETSQYITDSTNENGLGDVLMWCDNYSLTGMVGSDSITMFGQLSMSGSSGFGCSTEYGVCTGRLRRWQMYDDIAEESFGE